MTLLRRPTQHGVSHRVPAHYRRAENDSNTIEPCYSSRITNHLPGFHSPFLPNGPAQGTDA